MQRTFLRVRKYWIYWIRVRELPDPSEATNRRIGVTGSAVHQSADGARPPLTTMDRTAADGGWPERVGVHKLLSSRCPSLTAAVARRTAGSRTVCMIAGGGSGGIFLSVIRSIPITPARTKIQPNYVTANFVLVSRKVISEVETLLFLRLYTTHRRPMWQSWSANKTQSTMIDIHRNIEIRRVWLTVYENRMCRK